MLISKGNWQRGAPGPPQKPLSCLEVFQGLAVSPTLLNPLLSFLPLNTFGHRLWG